MHKLKYKILAISDNGILKKFSVGQLQENFGDVDFILSAGDVGNDYLDYLFTALNKELIYVNGNHVYNKYHNIEFCTNIDAKVIKFKGLKIFGLDGSRVYSFKEHQYTEIQMGFRILKNIFGFLGKKVDIVISHASPRHIHDEEDHVHKGFRVFNYFIKICKPSLWLHGHNHLSSHHEIQETYVGETRILNVYGYKVIEFESEEK